MERTGSNRLLIRPFRPGDLPQLLDFLRRHYPASPHKFDAARFQHRFADHPWGSSLDRYLLALEGDEIVGQLAALPDRLHCQGSWHDAWWLVDLMVAPEHRGGLAALRLFQNQMATGSLLLATGAGSRLATLYAALGWRRRPIAESCYLPIRPGRLLNVAASTGRMRRNPLLGPILWTADLALPWAQRLHYLVRRQTVDVEPLHELGKEIDQLVGKLLPSLGSTCWRSAETLNWKLNRAQGGSSLAFTARRRTSGELCGYLIAKLLRRGESATWVEVIDHLAAPDDGETFDALTSAVVWHALAEKVDFVRWRVSCPQHLARLRSPWWLRRTEPVSDEVFVYSRDAGVLTSLSEDTWYLTSLASDRADGGTEIQGTNPLSGGDG